MTRVDLEQGLAVVVVERAVELLRPVRAGGRIEAPGRAVRDHDRFDAPVVELLEQDVRRVDELLAIEGQVAHGDAQRARVEIAALLEEAGEAVHARLAERMQECAALQRAEGVAGGDPRPGARGTDRPGRDLAVLEIAQDDVLVAVVLIGGRTDLRPFPAEEGDRIGLFTRARDVVAGPDARDRLRPVGGGDALGMVVDRPEIEGRAEAREIASIGGRMGAIAAGHREAQHEGVEGEGRMDVEIAEQDLLGGGGGLRVRDRGHRPPRVRHLSGPLVLAEPAAADRAEPEAEHDEKQDRDDGDDAGQGAILRRVGLPERATSTLSHASDRQGTPWGWLPIGIPGVACRAWGRSVSTGRRGRAPRVEVVATSLNCCSLVDNNCQ